MFDSLRALKPVRFIECLKHGDDFYGQPFILLPWQQEAVSSFYGTLRDDDSGIRQYQFLYLEIPKKNGKSELAAALGLFHLLGDGVINGEIYICAADRDNAGIIFSAALSMVEQSRYLSKRLKIQRSLRQMVDPVTKSKMKVLSAEAYSKHGYKPSCVIFDELHSQPNRDLWDIMTFGAGAARRQPVWIVLTTAGDDPDRKSIGWEIHEYARKVLAFRAGEEDGLDDPVWLPYIYSAPEDADIYDEKVWFTANPSLGHSIQLDTVRQEALQARNSEAAERLFRWLRLNQWIAVKAVGWLPLSLFDDTVGDFKREDMAGESCYMGLDLSSTTDLTALALVFPPTDERLDWRVLFEAWLPQEKLQERMKRDRVPFDRWVKKGYLHITPGNAVDYDFIQARIIQLTKMYDVKLLGTDPWNSRMLTQVLMKEGVDCVEITQDMKRLSPAMKRIDTLLRTAGMTHEAHPPARWCFGNTRVAVDGNENIKPMKNRSPDRIDIAVAWIIAVATAMTDIGDDLNDYIMSDDWGL